VEKSLNIKREFSLEKASKLIRFLIIYRLNKIKAKVAEACDEYNRKLKGKENPEILRENMVENIRQTFLRYFVNLFKNYEKFLKGKILKISLHI